MPWWWYTYFTDYKYDQYLQIFWCDVKTFAKKSIKSHWKQFVIKKKVKLPDNEDRQDEWTAAGEDADNRTDDNIDERTQKFQNQLKNVYWYRIPLKIYMRSRVNKNAD